MKTFIKKVRSKYIIQNIFSYTSFKKTIKIIQYNKNLINKLEYTVDDIKNFFFFNKIIKPISNCEDYLPIIKRILSSKRYTFKQISNVFCNYLNKTNNKFIPQISQIEGNEYILDKLDSFKLGFNKQILEYFSNFYLFEDKSLYIKKLSEFCKKYGKKIKEITFMDKEIENVLSEDINYYTIIYIIKNCNIEKIEDCFSDNKMNSIFMGIVDDEKIFEKDYYININNSEGEEKKDKDLICSIKKLKSYSLYFDKISDFMNNDLIKNLCDYILINGQNIEELEITKITKSSQLNFLNSIKNLIKLKSLIISTQINSSKFFQRLSKKVKRDSLCKLEINLNKFEDGFNIIDKNINSLTELTLTINHKMDSKIIIKTISEITKLKKLRIISKFEILDEDNIKYLFLKNVEYLEIPLYVTNYLFDLNLLFEKTPKLKKLIFYGININDDIDKKYKNMKILDEFNLNIKFVQKLRKINFLNSDKKSSFIIIKLIEIFLKSNIKENIKEIKIDNCDFDEKVNFNVLLKLISSFTNIKSLSLNNNSYEIGEQINYDEINNFNYLEKFYFKGLDYEKNEIKILYFLYKFSEKCRVLNELGFSCKGQNPYDMNIIFKVVKNYRLLTKLNIFDNYSKSDYYSDKEVLSYLSGINIGELNNYCLCDLRNIDLKKENKKNSSVNFNQYNKLIIKDYLHQNNNNLISNKKEKYYSYQNFFKSISFSNKLCYSGKEKSFIIGDMNESLTLLKK